MSGVDPLVDPKIGMMETLLEIEWPPTTPTTHVAATVPAARNGMIAATLATNTATQAMSDAVQEVLGTFLSVVGVLEIALKPMEVLEAAMNADLVAGTGTPATMISIIGGIATTDPIAPETDPEAPGADPAVPGTDPAAPQADPEAPGADPAAPNPQDHEALIANPLPLPEASMRALGCPILAPSPILGQSPFPLHLHLALGPNILRPKNFW